MTVHPAVVRFLLRKPQAIGAEGRLTREQVDCRQEQAAVVVGDDS